MDISLSVKSKLKRLSFYSSLSAITLVMGLFREIFIASYFGLSRELDVYVALNSLYLILGMQLGNALEMAAISRFGKNPTVDYLKLHYVPIVIFLLGINIIIGFFIIEYDRFLVGSIFSGFSDYQLELSSEIMIYIILASICANISGFNRGNLNLLRQFSPNFLNGAIISIVIIAFVFVFGEEYGINALVIGFLGGNVLVFIIYSYSLYKKSVIDFSAIKKFSYNDGLLLIKAASLIAIGEFLFQIFIVSIRSNATSLGEGVVSSFFYANTLVLVPVTLVMFPLSTILFPKLTKLFSSKGVEGKILFFQAASALILLSLLSSIVMYILSFQLIKLIFVRGQFTLEDAELTSSIFSVLIFMLPALSVSRMIKMAHYSMDSFRAPILSNLILAGSIISIAYYLVPIYGIYGLSISAVISMYISVASLFVLLLMKMKLWYA